MNQRVIKITTSINKLAISDNEKLTQGDKNTHFIDIKFLDDINLIGYQLLVLYKLPFPDETVLVDTYNSLQTEMKLLIPNHALMRSGELTVEFALKKEKELITINKNLTLEVISTVNAAYVEDIQLGDTTKQTIAEQLEKLTTLLAQAQTEIDRYDENVTNKTNEFDKHVEVSKTAIDDYINEKKQELKGDKGDTGEQGPKGDKGDIGPIGPQGGIGPQGAVGERGPRGDRGEVGPIGPQGEKGDIGPKGDTGDIGPAGAKGDPGPQGATGVQGPVGPMGPRGEKGAKGDKGDKGDTLVQTETGEVIFDTSTVLARGDLSNQFKDANAIVKALQANTGMKFDEGLLYLNDAGTKKVGFCYLDRLTDGIFECIKQTTAVVNDSACFRNFSNKENSDRLGNLSKPKYINKDWNLTGVTAEQVITFLNKALENYDYIYIFMRETSNIELDCKLLSKKENAEISFYHSNGTHNFKLIGVHPDPVKLSYGWGNYLTIRYASPIRVWYLSSDKGATKT